MIRFAAVLMCFTFVRSTFGDVAVSVDPDSHLVMQGDGEQLLGIEFQSPSSSLVPGPSEDAGPFHGFLRNNSSHVTYFIIGDVVTLDGSVTLPTRWDAERANDVLFQWGTFEDESQLQPIAGHVISSGQVSLSPPTIQDPSDLGIVNITLDASNRFVAESESVALRSLEFTSAAGSVVPGPDGDSGPFVLLLENTSNRVAYVSPALVNIEGSLTLPAGWNPSMPADVRYSYQTVNNDASNLSIEYGNGIRPLAIEPGLEPDTDPAVPAVDGDYTIDFDERDAVVTLIPMADGLMIKGNGQEITSLTISSRNGELVPGGQSDDFDALLSDTPFEVSYSSTLAVTLDDDLILPAAWSGFAEDDLTFTLQVPVGNPMPVTEVFSSAQLLPEPSSRALLLVASLLLLRWRNNRELHIRD